MEGSCLVPWKIVVKQIQIARFMIMSDIQLTQYSVFYHPGMAFLNRAHNVFFFLYLQQFQDFSAAGPII